MQTPRLDWDENRKVEDLIDSQSKQWKWEILHEMLSSDEASNICKIPISKLGSRDVFVCHPDHSGAYSVKSAYRWLTNRGHHILEQGMGANQALGRRYGHFWFQRKSRCSFGG